jgi:pimeloyl-ACP methyl ester carboxylesterase
MRKHPTALFVIASMLLGAARAAETPAGTHRFCVVNGARLYTEIIGHGPPILFLHGGLLFFDINFEHQRDDFARDHTVIGIDQRGHGHSPDTAGPRSYQAMADDTAAVLEQLGLGPVDVVGHSDGGDIALLLARDHPELVRRVVISGANLRSGLTPEEYEQRRHWSAAQLAQKVRAVADSLPPFFRAGYDQVSPDGPGHWLALVAKDYEMWLTPVVIAPADLKRISAPVLVMAGDHDFTPLDETVEIWRNLPHGQLMIVPGTGHGTFLQRPELVNLAIREFLTGPADAPPAH